MLVKVESRSTDLFIDEEVASADVFGDSKPDVNKNETPVEDESLSNEDSNGSLAFVKPEFKAEVRTLPLPPFNPL